MPWYLQAAILFVAGGLFAAGLGFMFLIGYRCLMLLVSVDAGIFRELHTRPLVSSFQPQPSNLHQYAPSQVSPTDGDFVYNTDEELAIAEEVRRIKAQNGSLTPEDEKELMAQIRQGGVTI